MGALLGRLSRALKPDATGIGRPTAPQARAPAVAVPGLIEPLSGRELEVLRCWRRAR